MYEEERQQARNSFLANFVWNDQDTCALRVPVEEHVPCQECGKPAHIRLYDVEDEQSGGTPLCLRHSIEYVYTIGGHTVPEWVSQEPAQAWIGPNGFGWNKLWLLFTPPGTYSQTGLWPLEDWDDTERWPLAD